MLPLHKLPVNPVVIMLPNLPPGKRSQSQEHVGSFGVVIHIAVRLRLEVREESNCRKSVLCILTRSIGRECSSHRGKHCTMFAKTKLTIL